MRITAKQAAALGIPVPKGKSKFGAKKVEFGGITFDSRAEFRRYQELRLLLSAGEISEIEVHPDYDVVINGVKVCRYKADFRYREYGKLVVEDVKSKGTRLERDWRLKKRLIEAVHGIEIKEVIR